MFKTFKEAKDYCTKNKIAMVDFKMIDIDGRWRHITIPATRFKESIMEDGIGFDGSNYGFAPVENSDMVFIPDVTTASIDPFVEVPTLQMIGDVKIIDKPDNREFDQDPRNVAKHAEAYLKTTGIADEYIIGPEFEFHILEHVDYETSPQRVAFNIDTPQAAWNTGYEGFNLGYEVPAAKGYHTSAPQDITYNLRSEIAMMLEERGVEVKYHHHEVGGSGQVEVEVEFGPMSKMADDTMLIKYIVKNAAVAHGKTATFMPKPVYGEAGNGMHVHMLLRKKGKPIFYDEKGYSSLSKEAHWFIGGILKHIRSLCAFTNPSTNSFKRLIPGFEAPVTIGYATANRSAVIRIPAYAKTPDKKRFELRNPDATCNPYYCYSAILMAGLDGIQNKIDPKDYNWGPFDFNLYDLSPEEAAKLEQLPFDLDQCLDALEQDHEYLTRGGVFPERLIELWVEKKRAENKAVRQIPHPAEFELYYDL